MFETNEPLLKKFYPYITFVQVNHIIYVQIHICLLTVFTTNCTEIAYFFNFCICGALILTFPGIFLATVSSLTAFNKSLSLEVISLSFKNTAIAVFAAFPLLPVPGVSFTLNLKYYTLYTKNKNFSTSVSGVMIRNFNFR